MTLLDLKSGLNGREEAMLASAQPGTGKVGKPMYPKTWLSEHSLYFESYFTHLLLQELMHELLMTEHPRRLTVLKAEVDSEGYDLVLACGPTGFVARVEALLREAAARIATESFTPPVLRVPDVPAAAVQLTLLKSGRTLSIPTDTPLLAALEAAGLKPEHGCRQGLCGRCTCAKASGVHVDLRDDSAHPEASTALKLCVSAARTDLAIDL